MSPLFSNFLTEGSNSNYEKKITYRLLSSTSMCKYEPVVHYVRSIVYECPLNNSLCIGKGKYT